MVGLLIERSLTCVLGPGTDVGRVELDTNRIRRKTVCGRLGLEQKWVGTGCVWSHKEVGSLK